MFGLIQDESASHTRMEIFRSSVRNLHKLGPRRFRSIASAGTLLFRLPGTAPPSLKEREATLVLSSYPLTSTAFAMPIATHHLFSKLSHYALDSYMKDAHSLPIFDDSDHFASTDSDQMLFGPLDFEESPYHETTPSYPWGDTFHENEIEPDVKPIFGFPGTPSSPPFDYHPSPTDSYYESGGMYSPEMKESPSFDNNLYMQNWINDPDIQLMASPSSPIPIPSTPDTSQSPPFVAFRDNAYFPQDSAFSPTSFAALHPLPSSPTTFEDRMSAQRQRVNSVSPQDIALHTPSWASSLWDSPSPSSLRTPSSSRPSVRHSPLNDNTVTVRQRAPLRRGSISSGQIFQSSSAPSLTEPRACMTRSYSRRAESVSVSDDRDATVRRKKRLPTTDDAPTQPAEKAAESREYLRLLLFTATASNLIYRTVMKSVLRPPKLAPSAWQLYFTDWIQRHQATNTRKLNVAQAAKEAGQEYASLTTAEKEVFGNSFFFDVTGPNNAIVPQPYKRRSQAAKEAREQELAAYMRTLTPEDIKRENAFRAAQRKAGKSRKSNIKDPNAPKKPLSAYFMFLQRIRANPQLVREIFGDETETTKQSVLAAAKWRSMTDGERQVLKTKPFIVAEG